MLIGLHLANAQEPDDTPQGAITIVPNGPSQIHAFSFRWDKDWFNFSAIQGVNYQIFTRPKNPDYPYNIADTVMYLFSDPAKGHIAYNDDFKNDGTSLIEWTCPASGIYFVRVQAYDSGRYGPQELYSIQITSIDRQKAHTIILDVPDYSQSDFGDSGNCGAVAAACILGYWDDHGYDRLVDLDPDRIEDVEELVHELQEAMHYNIFGEGADDDEVRTGIELVCNTPNYDNNYDFKVVLLLHNPIKNLELIAIIKDEIGHQRPVLYGLAGHSIWQNHWMVSIGFLETATTFWTINHDTWSTTHRDIYVDWDEATDCIITIQQGKKEDSGSGSSSTSPNYQSIIPYFGVQSIGALSPFGFGMSPFTGLAALPVTTLFSPMSVGFLGQYNLGGTGNIVWPGSLEGSGNIRFMSGNNLSEPFSPYGYNYNINGFNNYNTSEFNNINSNTPQETHFASNLNFYAPMDVSYQSPVSFSNNPFFSTPQMFIPGSGLFPYPMLSPFFSFSPSPFLYGFPF